MVNGKDQSASTKTGECLMSQFLASVTNLHEAEVIVRAGADILDLKNPQAGALGALDINTIREIVSAFTHRITVSATVGDITNTKLLAPMVEAIAATGVDIIKIGYFPELNADEFCQIVNGYTARNMKIVVVFFSDTIDELNDIESIIEDTCAYGYMLDTANKKDDLLSCLSIEELSEFVALCKERDSMVGLAGSLSQYDIPVLLPLSADYLGFRGALCTAHERTNTIDELAVYRVRQALDSVRDREANLSENSL